MPENDDKQALLREWELKLKAKNIRTRMWLEQKPLYEQILEEAKKNLNYIDNNPLIFEEFDRIVIERFIQKPSTTTPTQPEARINKQQPIEPLEQAEPALETAPYVKTEKETWDFDLRVQNAIRRLWEARLTNPEFYQLEEEARKKINYKDDPKALEKTKQEIIGARLQLQDLQQQKQQQEDQQHKLATYPSRREKAIDDLRVKAAHDPVAKKKWLEYEKIEKIRGKKEGSSSSVSKSKLDALTKAQDVLLGLIKPSEMVSSLQKGYAKGFFQSRTKQAVQNTLKLAGEPANEQALDLLKRVQDHLLKLQSKGSQSQSKAIADKIKLLTLVKEGLSGDLDEKSKVTALNAINKAQRGSWHKQATFGSATEKLVDEAVALLGGNEFRPRI